MYKIRHIFIDNCCHFYAQDIFDYFDYYDADSDQMSQKLFGYVSPKYFSLKFKRDTISKVRPYLSNVYVFCIIPQIKKYTPYTMIPYSFREYIVLLKENKIKMRKYH